MAKTKAACVRATLAVSEIALAGVLLGAGLLLQSFFHLMRIDCRLRLRRVLTFQTRCAQ